MIDQRARRLRHEHLAAVCGAGDPGGAVDIEAEVFVTDERRLASVQPDAHLNASSLGPGMRLQRELRRRRATAGIQRATENDEERVALGAQLVAAMLGQGFAEHRVMGEQHVGVALAELLDESRRAFDIAEKEGDGTGGQAHAGDGDALST